MTQKFLAAFQNSKKKAIRINTTKSNDVKFFILSLLEDELLRRDKNRPNRIDATLPWQKDEKIID